eukprot:7352173-Pyramimonas_sp.AAC.3
MTSSMTKTRCRCPRKGADCTRASIPQPAPLPSFTHPLQHHNHASPSILAAAKEAGVVPQS